MAAEILDIEAKLDTSRVKGQLQQLSKTSGLQGLDRAIKTLEASMKKLATAMDQQTQQTQRAQMGGYRGGMQGQVRDTLGVFGLRTAGRSLAGRVIGGTLESVGGLVSEGYDRRIGKKISDLGGLTKNVAAGALMGAGAGSFIPGVGTAAGAGIGAALGALNSAVEALTYRFKELGGVLEGLQKRFEQQEQRNAKTLGEIDDRQFARAVHGMSFDQAARERESMARALEGAEKREKRAADAVKQY